MSMSLAEHTQFGLFLHATDPAGIRDAVALCDRVGFHSLWQGDHISFGPPIQDPFSQLSYAAALSDKLTFGTSVLLVPLRQPAGIAKQAVTMDYLTQGRFILGAGVGGEFPKEFEMMGVPVDQRGARMEESVEIMKKLWSGGKVSYQGKFFQFEDCDISPAPLTPGGPPI
jgi:alkanesulfonate monooxygenase SsuD/methylene tetrahydromethanopterin reductase-like flavin-dependent oxidoreductase (luciferase family)